MYAHTYCYTLVHIIIYDCYIFVVFGMYPVCTISQFLNDGMLYMDYCWLHQVPGRDMTRTMSHHVARCDTVGRLIPITGCDDFWQLSNQAIVV